MQIPEQIEIKQLVLRKYIIHPNVGDIPRDSYLYAITK
jgi:hypothetical protein